MNYVGCFWIALLEVPVVAAMYALWRYQKKERAEEQKHLIKQGVMQELFTGRIRLNHD